MRNRLTPRDFSMAVALVAIWLVFALKEPVFLSSRNLSLLAIELSVTAILALGMLIVLLPAQIDLSAGSGVGLAGGVASVLVLWHNWPAPLALLVALAGAVLLWALMGVLITIERVPAFIVTLGGLLVFKGLHWLVIRTQTVPVSQGGTENLYSLLTTYYVPTAGGWVIGGLVMLGLVFAKLTARRRRRAHGLPVEDRELTFLGLFLAAQAVTLTILVMNQYRGVPLAVLTLGGAALGVHVLTGHTRFGRYLYAIGSNEEASLLSGIPVHGIVIGAFALMGVCVGLTGFLQTAYSGASTTTVGSLMELDAVAACVIGGTSLRGGRGTVLGVLFGSLIMATLLNGMTLMAVSPEIKFVARGAILALAVWMDVRLSNK